jgi:hypothetical protein
MTYGVHRADHEGSQFSQRHGLEVVSGRWDEDASLPKHVTVDVLESGERFDSSQGQASLLIALMSTVRYRIRRIFEIRHLDHLYFLHVGLNLVSAFASAEY